MKTIGLIGGMSWESSVSYYQVLNQVVKQRFGGLHSAKCVLYSVDFAEIAALQKADQWETAGEILAQAARNLVAAGAECIVLCTNTMHLVATAIEQAVEVPFIHIVDPTAAAIQQQQLTTIGLLGTRFTMEHDFYAGRLRQRYGLAVVTPEPEQRDEIHRIIFDELCLGKIDAGSKAYYLAVINDLVAAGAQGIILGCTEIGLLINQADCDVPLFDTTLLHGQAAVAWSLAK